MNKSLLVLPVILGSVFLAACDDDRVGGSVHVHRSGYVGAGGYGDADFYYVSGRPYSRYYGPLVYRDDRYYYRTGGRYVVYDRPTVVRRNVIHRNVRRDVVRYRDVDDDRFVTRRGTVRYDDGARYQRTNVRRTVVDGDARTRYDSRRSGARMDVDRDYRDRNIRISADQDRRSIDRRSARIDGRRDQAVRTSGRTVTDLDDARNLEPVAERTGRDAGWRQNARGGVRGDIMRRDMTTESPAGR